YPNALNYDFSSASDIFLQVEVSTDNASFQTLAPRQRISSSAFAQVAGSVRGTNQSAIGTNAPVSDAVLTVAATTTATKPLVIKGILGQLASLFDIQDSTGSSLFSVGNTGAVTLSTASSTALSGLD